MALSFPRVPVVEWYLDGWQDISTDVRQKPALQITQARRDWSSKTPPCSCRFTLDDGPDHGDGDYNPENPTGQWFDQLDRNMPIRVSLPIASDTFARTVSNGWGTADTGEAWTNAGGSGGSVVNGDWNVAGGVGTHSIPVANGYRYSVLAGSYLNVTVTATTTVALGDITGGSIEPGNVIVRSQGGAVYYMARVTITSAETVTISIHHSSAGELVAPVTVAGLVTIASPKTIRVKLQAEDETIRAKVYAPGAEPVGWHVEVHDTLITAAGTVGIRNGVAAGNSNTKPIVFSVDDFTVEAPRFFGEVAKMVPLTSVDHQDRRTTVECAGARRRLEKGSKALHTALRRYLTGGTTPFGLAEFWPLDEPQETDVHGGNVLGGLPAEFRRSTTGAVKWGIDTGLLQLPRAVELSYGGFLYLQTDPAKYSGANGWGFVWMQRLGSDSIASTVISMHDGTQLFLKIETGVMTLTWQPSATVLLSGVPVPELGDDNAWHVVGLGCHQSGSNIAFHLSIDDVSYADSRAGTCGLPTWMRLDAWNAGLNYVFQVGQVVAITNAILTGSPWHISTLNRAYRGWPGETAGSRFANLCAEEGVSYALAGDPDDTPALGPQRPLPFMTLIQECVDVIQGSAYDLRGTPGLAVRTPRSVVEAPVAVTLDYSAGTIAPEFGPVRDDQQTANDITAKRPSGGEFRVEQATGPNNTSDPGTALGAVGRVDADVTVNVQTDTQLPEQAGWRVHMGTMPGPRYPTVTIDLAADALRDDAALTQAVLDVGVDDKLTITDAQARHIYDDVRLIVRGWTETIGTAYEHRIVFNTTPAEAYDGAVAESTETARAGSGSSTTNASFVAGTGTSLSVAVANPTALWTRDASRFPFNIRVSGAVLEVTAITGTSSPQTFTITQTPVNGVAKTIPAGSVVDVETPVYLVP